MTAQTPVGIDLGTTFSAIAHLDIDGRPLTITNSEGELTTPSVVFFDSDAVIVGTEAAFAGESDVRRMARAAKRDMGGTRFRTTIADRHLPPEVIQSFVLMRLKVDAELKLGPITKAVITVPAYFNEPRRKATQDAGELAGIEVIDIINEPTAAALAYGVQRGFLNEKGEARERELILVYDLGGGTFDVTLMEIHGSNFRALATAGDVYLGGIDWDQRLFEFARSEFSSQHRIDFDSDSTLNEKLLTQCVRAKKSLTARSETTIRLEYAGQRYTLDVTRQQFEELTLDLLERTRLTTERLLSDAKMKWTDLTKLLLVGGSTRMPMVLSMLERESGLEVDRSLSPDEAVAHGAAIYAGILLKHGSSAGQGISVTNVNSHDLGVLGVDPKTREPRRKVVIPRNHSLPVRAAKRFQTFKDGQRSIVVKIVEGGTEEGLGATAIGKCVVSELPTDIKQGTEVVVSFNYLSSGRLEVLAQIPSLKISAKSDIDRAAGMSTEQLEQWKRKLATGVKFLEAEPLVRKPDNIAKPGSGRMVKSMESSSKPISNRQGNKNQNAPMTKPAQTGAVLPSSMQPQPQPTTRPVEKKPEDRSLEKSQTENSNLIPQTSALDFEVTDQSGIFAFGDDDLKPDVGASFLGVLGNTDEANEKSAITDSVLRFLSVDEDGNQKLQPGDSILDILTEGEKQKPDDSDSALEDFLSELKE